MCWEDSVVRRKTGSGRQSSPASVWTPQNRRRPQGQSTPRLSLLPPRPSYSSRRDVTKEGGGGVVDPREDFLVI